MSAATGEILDFGVVMVLALIVFTLALRYLFFAGGAYLLVHRLLAKRLAHKRIQPSVPDGAQIRREALYSLSTFVIFAVMALGVRAAAEAGWTRLYFDISDYGWAYFALSIALMVALHDFYFYWTHRLMHWGPIYRHVHAVHHRSTNPSPFAAFAFHPLEAVIEFGVIVVIVFLLPVHPFALLGFVTIMIVFNVIGHLGFELFPRRFSPHVTRVLNTATHHNQHHRTFRYNFGLYTNIWDRFFGTNHPRYDETFERIAARRRVRPRNARATAPDQTSAGSIKSQRSP